MVTREGVTAQKAPVLGALCVQHQAVGDCRKTKLNATFHPRRLGVKLMSKTLPVATCDDATSGHVHTDFALRAWVTCRGPA